MKRSKFLEALSEKIYSTIRNLFTAYQLRISGKGIKLQAKVQREIFKRTLEAYSQKVHSSICNSITSIQVMRHIIKDLLTPQTLKRDFEEK